MWIKICGTTSLEDAQVAVNAGADALGFVFAASPRQVTAAQAGEIISGLGPAVEKIGVFVDEDYNGIVSTILTARLTGVQLHSGIDSAITARLREHFPAGQLRILRVTHFQQGLEAELHAVEADAALDGVLVDSRTATLVGGTGMRFDWQAASRSFFEAAPHERMIVAGGLNPENVREAIETLHPWGVDVVSGVEAAPGRKDAAKVRAFVENARNAALHPKDSQNG